MTISFPATPPTLGVSQQAFEPDRVDYLSPDGRGRVGSVTAGIPLWRLEWTLGLQTVTRTDAWRAFVIGQRGVQRQFYAYDLYRPTPKAYPSGAGYSNPSSWSHTVDAGGVARLTLNGLTAGQIISQGDYIGFVWSTSKRALVRNLEAVTANGSGVAVIAIEPALPTAVPGTATINLTAPTALFRLLPETKLAQLDRLGRLPGGSIIAIQDLVA